ncbi:MAG: DinB family protein [Vicinamibacterales bacterium]
MTDTAFRTALKAQYHAALAMLREAVERCPPAEWTNAGHKNAFWQVAYHTLFFTHLYLQRDEVAFQRWAQHRGGDDGTSGAPYTQTQVLEYWSFCDGIVDGAVDALDLDSPESGFSWYRMSKLEHQLVNIRHIQHHGAQLADRLRSAANIGIVWVSSGRSRAATDGHVA